MKMTFAHSLSRVLRGMVLSIVCLLAWACSQPATNGTETAAPAPPNSALTPPPPPTPKPEDAQPRLTVEQAKTLVDQGKAVIIDVRGPDAYRLGHIKDALDVPLAKLEAGDFANLPKDKRIIAYCSCPNENTSSRAALLLNQGGFKEASALLGGNHAWEAAGYPMVKSASAATH